ncbi:MAG: V-type ATP synthase subunit I [Acutalibacteraceae bacterium]
MKKIEIIALLSDGQKIVERLQRRGVVELSDLKDEKLVKLNTASSISHFEKNIALASEALEILNSATHYKKPMLDMLSGREEITTEEFAKRKEESQQTLSVCYDITAAAKKISDCKNAISGLQTKSDTLVPWMSLELPQNFKGTKSTSAFIGTLPGELSKDEAEKLIGEKTEAAVQIEIISSRKEMTYLIFTCHKDDTAEVSGILRDLNFAAIQSRSPLTPKEESEKIREQISDCDEKILKYEKEIISFGNKQEDIKFLIDLLQMSLDKYASIAKLATTNETIVISGFIPAKYADGLVKEFEKKYTVAITVSDPDEADDVPVLLQNGGFASPVEGITEMYALPSKRDVDPNPVMAFFYYFFFGMMLSDAGYGLLMVIVTSIVLAKTKVEGTLRRSIKMFQYCGISTLFWGALFGSWFGDLPQVIASNYFGKTIKTTALWFEPINDPVTLLLFCFLFGIIHLFAGLAVNLHILWKEGKKFDALCEVIPIYITVIGVCPFGAGILTSVPPVLTKIGGYVAIAGVILIILTAGRSSKNVFMRFFGGIYGLYNTATGYLGDILSYSRLLALGLATGSIASVINLLATMPSNMVLKTVMLIVVGTAGHILNLLINLLGAYVHTDRLQFVEMFSKFYEGGGRAFAPLKSNTKSFKFKKENIYE